MYAIISKPQGVIDDMKMTYKEYLDIVPKETKKLVNNSLPYLWFYLIKGNNIEYSYGAPFYTIRVGDLRDAKMTAALLLGASKDLEMRAIFEKHNFFPKKISNYGASFELTDEEKKITFERSLEIFTPYIDITKYRTIQPIDIINNAINYDKYGNGVEEVLKYLNVTYPLRNEITILMKDEHKKQELEIERRLFNNLSASVINYLETASKIRTLFINKMEYGDVFENANFLKNNLLKNDDTHIVPISLLLGIYKYEGLYKKEIEEYFESKGVTYNSIKKYLKFDLLDGFNKIERNMEAIDELYKKYLVTDERDKEKEEDITVLDIINNLLDRNFIETVVIDRLFEKIGISAEDFKNFKDDIKNIIARKKEYEEFNYANSFYKDLRKDTKEFISFTTKAYQLLLKKMQCETHNKELLNCEDDADTLALYIASHYFNTDFEKFYVDYGVTFEKVMQLLNLSITKEEIDKEELNKRTVVDRLGRFVMSGVNSDKKQGDIYINDVAYNLCSRDFNKSMIMENIFEEIRRDIDLPEDFKSVIEEHFEEKEKLRKNNLIEGYFRDKPSNIYKYLENVCKAYKTLEYLKIGSKYNKDELTALSLLYGVFISLPDISELYGEIGLTEDKVDKYLKIEFHKKLRGELDIDLIINQIDPYINACFVKNLNEELTLEKITENIFTSKRQKSFKLSQLLDYCNLSYSSFDDFTDVKKKVAERHEKERIKEETDRILKQHSYHEVLVIRGASMIYQVLEDVEIGHIKRLTSKEKENISMLLSILREESGKKCDLLDKYGMNYCDMVNILGLPENFYGMVNSQCFNPKVFLEHFKEYGTLTINNVSYLYGLFRNLLKKDSDIIINSLETLGVDYKAFKFEIFTGKDYESTLTIDDRSALLKDVETKDLFVSDMSNIVVYGNELSTHTKFINDKCTQLVFKGENSESLKNIQEVLRKIYEKKSLPTRNRTLFEKLMGVEIESKEEIKINGTSISELKSVISNYINPLYEDIKMFDSLVKYLEIYRRKVKEHEDKVNEKLSLLELELKNTTEDNFEKLLRLQTYIKAVEAKRDSFALTEQLVKQYIYKAYIVMQNNLVTLSGLEISRDALIPLLEAEVILGSSIPNQVNGAKVTESVVNLLSEIVAKNANGIRVGVEAIKSSGVSEDKLLRISHDVTKYLSQLDNLSASDTVILEELPLQTSVKEEDEVDEIKVMHK